MNGTTSMPGTILFFALENPEIVFFSCVETDVMEQKQPRGKVSPWSTKALQQ